MGRSWSRAEEDRIIGLARLCRDARQLKQIHAHIVVNAQSHNTFLLAKLVRTFAAFGSLHHARSLTDTLPIPNVFVWTAMIRGYTHQPDSNSCRDALLLYTRLHRSGDRPLTFTLSSVLKACARLSALTQGAQVHAHVVKCGFHSEAGVQTTLIDFYACCGRVFDAGLVFDTMPVHARDVQAWNTLVAAHAKLGDMESARELFDKMPEWNLFTWVEMITGYANCGRMDSARTLVDSLLPRGDRNVVVYTAIIAGYAKCGDVLAARVVFDEMTERDVASWNAMLSAYSQAGLFEEAVDLFRLMLETRAEQLRPNQTTMATVVSACAQLGSKRLANWVENYIDGRGRELVNIHTVTALIDMHAKCGDPNKAYAVFQRLKDKDTVCYSSMIAGFGIHGCGLEALRIFSRLQEEGLKPDGICFIGVLSACSHAGLVDEGCHYFKSMREQYSITPTADHYMCMVDLLGRAGRIDDAYRIITTLMPPVQPHAGVWGALLSACRIYSNVEIGEVAAQHLLELEPENAGNYVLLSNIYAKARRWDDVARVRALMRSRGMRKPPGYSWIEVDGRVCKFLTNDVLDPLLQNMMEVLAVEMKAQGYFPTIDHDG